MAAVRSGSWGWSTRRRIDHAVHNWGDVAVRRIGEPKLLMNPLNYDDVALVPTVIDVDNFYANMAHDIMTRSGTPDRKLLTNFIYMAHGVSDERLGSDLAAFRAWAIGQVNNNNGDDT